MEVKSEHVRLYSLPGWKLHTNLNNHYFRPEVETKILDQGVINGTFENLSS